MSARAANLAPPDRSRRVPASGLRAPHYRDLIESRPDVDWLEVHSENCFGDGGAPFYYLERARAHYPISLHGGTFARLYRPAQP